MKCEFPFIFKNTGNPLVTKFLTWAPHGSVDVTNALLKSWCAEYNNPDRCNWVIEYHGEPIGGIDVVYLNKRSEWEELGYFKKDNGEFLDIAQYAILQGEWQKIHQ
jgi:RimJ/RimL family protein N-acetyltransferase